MLSIAIDAALIAVPSLALDERSAETIVQRIIYWSKKVRGRGAIKFVQLSNVPAILAEANCFPSKPNIRALLELFNLDHVYSSEDIRRSVNLILEADSVAVDVWGVEVIRCATSRENPNLDVHYTVPVLREAASRLLASAICARIIEPAREIQIVPGDFP